MTQCITSSSSFHDRSARRLLHLIPQAHQTLQRLQRSLCIARSLWHRWRPGEVVSSRRRQERRVHVRTLWECRRKLRRWTAVVEVLLLLVGRELWRDGGGPLLLLLLGVLLRGVLLLLLLRVLLLGRIWLVLLLLLLLLGVVGARLVRRLAVALAEVVVVAAASGTLATGSTTAAATPMATSLPVVAAAAAVRRRPRHQFSQITRSRQRRI